MNDSIRERNTVITTGSVFISEQVTVGENNTFYPGVVIECRDGATVRIGDGNTFYSGTFIFASAGEIIIGSGNEFGPAGCTVRANTPTARIVVGDGGRYSDGANIMGETTLGSGSQVLGNITVQNCQLAAGGTYREADPDERAAVLKGFGLARGITLEAGQVINGKGDFAAAPVEWQRAYHPKPASN